MANSTHTTELSAHLSKYVSKALDWMDTKRHSYSLSPLL